MLHITTEAGVAITELAEQEGVAEDGGLRIERLAPEQDGITFSVAAFSEDTDVTVSEPVTGARVFLDSLAAEFTDDKTLDVDDTVAGEAKFSLATNGAD